MAMDASAQRSLLPEYTAGVSSASVTTEHSVSLDIKGVPWLSITVKSRAPKASIHPVFSEGDRICGNVRLDLAKPDAIKRVTVTARGAVTQVGQEESLFWHDTVDVWNPSLDSPNGRRASSSNKLGGKYTWPFTLLLPSTIKGSKGGKDYPLPPSFSERAGTAYIDYSLIVTVKRGAFRANHELSQVFQYQPFSVPEPPSSIHQAAHIAGHPLPGPSQHPDSWHTLQPISLTGLVFGTKSVQVGLTLSLAKPLSYAVGTAIPLFMSLKSSDEHTLALLASPSTHKITLVRTLIYGDEAIKEDVMNRSGPFHLSSVVGRAIFWPAVADVVQGTRTFSGEVQVKPHLKGTFIFPDFSVRYTLEVLPFQAAGFTPSPSTPEVLSSTSLLIAWAPTPGVSIRSYAPPGYVEPQDDNYNNSVGFLEQGNQRFLAHHGNGILQ